MFQNLIILFCFGFLISSTFSAVYLKTVNINCTGNPKYIFNNYTCRLKAINRYKPAGMMKLLIRKPLRNISINFAAYIRNDANVFKPFLVNATENLCRWFDHRSPSPYAAITKRVLEQFTNVNHSCPYTGFLITRNLVLDERILPVLELPKNSYKFKAIFYEGIKNIFEDIGSVTYFVDLIETRERKQRSL